MTLECFNFPGKSPSFRHLLIKLHRNPLKVGNTSFNSEVDILCMSIVCFIIIPATFPSNLDTVTGSMNIECAFLTILFSRYVIGLHPWTNQPSLTNQVQQGQKNC
ncbi:hypothetical protein HHI36_006259 [Cryptolaemus montrouzieri]|uniref:Uncharacterized protein n=1 Tax=Cryptolaemus montrouzieri TaxID=559131 RepID=A0ABD2NXZ2_9CUCU